MFLFLVALLVLTIFLFLKYIYSYWSRKGYPYVKPVIIPFGNLKSVATRQKSFGMAIYDLYLKTKEPFVGVYLFFRPALLIRDATLAKRILTTDFSSFHDRGVYCNEKIDPLSAHLFALPGEKWKNLRTTLSPAFTSGKLRNMFTTIEDVGNKMVDSLNRTLRIMKQETVVGGGSIVEMKEITSRYGIDIIASVIFGCENNSLENPENNAFRKAGIDLNQTGFWSNLRTASVFLAPKLLETFHIASLPAEVRNFMIGLVTDTIEYREKNNTVRKDFMQLLLQLRNTGELKGDDNWDFKNSSETNKSFSIEQCAAQVFVFYIAGFESSSSTTSFLLYELTQNEEIMVRLKGDITAALDKHNGLLNYDSIQDMKYLDQCVQETIRKYPALPILNRQCTKDYRIPNSNYIVEKGTAIIISTMGLQRDPNNFLDPLKFHPERFQAGYTNYFNQDAFLPFGDGPRLCIGLRLGIMIVKVAIVKLLLNFDFGAVAKKELEFDNHSVGLVAKGGINVRIFNKNNA